MSHAPAVRPPKSPPKPDQAAVEFRILGSLEVLKAGRPIVLGGPKQRLVLAMLILAANHVVSADRLIEEVWGDERPEAARSTLQAYVSRLRNALGPTRIEARGSGYMLVTSRLQIDASRFEDLVETAKASSARDRANKLTKALSLWRGPALWDFTSHAFALGEATRLNELRMHALEERIDAELALGRHSEVIGDLESLAHDHPLRERLCGQLMVALYRSGRQAEASAIYQETRARLVEELGMEPGPELRSLLTRILKQDPGLELAVEKKHRRTNLPVQLTSFVGREAELNDVIGLAHSERLVSLIGPGGVGKTRLAIEAGRLLYEREATIDSAFFIDLAPLQTPELLEQTVITALGGRLESSSPTVDTVVGLLGSGHSLVVIDNCEHLIDSVARFVDQLLRSHPRVHVLATSREALRIGPEARWTVSVLGEEDCMQLFVERARLIDTKFVLTEKMRPAVRTLCRGLDHLPLAVELAAARIGQMPVGEIVSRLDDRFALLTEGGRMAPARHHTLAIALDWSYQLLDAREKDVFARLSVFAGEFDAAAAQDVTNCTVYELGRLVEKSMVVTAEPGLDGRARYRLLETLREYASQRLDQTGNAREARERHFAFFANLAAHAGPELRGPNELHWLQLLGENLGNLRGALEWAVAEDPDRGLAMAVDLEWMWTFHDATEGRWWLRRLAAATRSPRPETVAAATRLAGDLAHSIGELDAARTEIARALDLWRAIGSAAGISRTLVNMAQVAGRTIEDLAKQQPLLEEALIQAQKANDDLLTLEALSFLGMALSHAGKSVEGRRYQLEAEVLARRVGHTWSVAYIIARDASAYLSEGDLERARARSEEAVELVRPSGDRRLHGLPAFLTLGLVYLAQDDFEAAREQFRTVLATDWIPVPSRLAIEGLAVLAARTERFIRALKLGGAASELLGSFARRGLPQHEMQHWIDVARRHVDPQGAEAAWRAGRAMSARELIDYALRDEDETTAANDVSVSQLTP